MSKKTKKTSAFRRFLQSPGSTALIFILAAALLAVGGIGAAVAVPSIQSNFYTSQIGMQDIGVSLLENGDIVSYRNYDTDKMDGTWKAVVPGTLKFDKITKLVPGVKYDEELRIQNTGSINTYNRVTVYKYWIDKNGKKATHLSPALIHLHYANTDVWKMDTSEISADLQKTPERSERVVLYYTPLLHGKIDEEGGQRSVPFIDKVTIDGVVATMVEATPSEDGKRVTTTYKYNDYSFCVEVVVDAVQEKNAEDAILSCWGKKVTISNNTITSGIS